MRIVGASIKWYDGYANSPQLIVEHEGSIPERSELRYEELHLEGSSRRLSREQEPILGERVTLVTPLRVLYAEHESGYVDFVQVGTETGTHRGMSGGTFVLVDGRTIEVRSGWTIASTAIRSHADVVECTFREVGDKYGLMAGFLKTDRARKVVAEFLAGVEMYDDGSGWTYKWRNGPTKSEWQRHEHELYVAVHEYKCRPYSSWPEFLLAHETRRMKRGE